jgi:chromosomal replication initiator protein
MFLGRIWTDCSLGEIGQHFGGRDHTTVMHSIDKIRTNVSENTTLRRDIESLEAALRQI